MQVFFFSMDQELSLLYDRDDIFFQIVSLLMILAINLHFV